MCVCIYIYIYMYVCASMLKYIKRYINKYRVRACERACMRYGDRRLLGARGVKGNPGSVVGAVVPVAVCRWGLCPCFRGVGRCLSGVNNHHREGINP